MAYFNPNTTVDSKARDTSALPVAEGQFLMTTDTGMLFYDTAAERVALTDILTLDAETDRTGLLAPLNKFYFVKETGALWRYDSGNWMQVSGAAASVTATSVTFSASDWTASGDEYTLTIAQADHGRESAEFLVQIRQSVNGTERSDTWAAATTTAAYDAATENITLTSGAAFDGSATFL